MNQCGSLAEAGLIGAEDNVLDRKKTHLLDRIQSNYSYGQADRRASLSKLPSNTSSPKKNKTIKQSGYMSNSNKSYRTTRSKMSNQSSQKIRSSKTKVQ